MRKIALIGILIFMTLSLALAQMDQNLTAPKIANPANTLSKNMSMPTLLGKPFFDLSQRGGKAAEFAYDIGMIKPVFDVSQRAGKPTIFNYTTGQIKPIFNASQRAGKLTVFNYTAGWIKPVYEVSAYSRIKPLYNISQFSRIKPMYQVSGA
jgi:hypothetical protein